MKSLHIVPKLFLKKRMSVFISVLGSETILKFDLRMLLFVFLFTETNVPFRLFYLNYSTNYITSFKKCERKQKTKNKNKNDSDEMWCNHTVYVVLYLIVLSSC